MSVVSCVGVNCMHLKSSRNRGCLPQLSTVHLFRGFTWPQPPRSYAQRLRDRNIRVGGSGLQPQSGANGSPSCCWPSCILHICFSLRLRSTNHTPLKTLTSASDRISVSAEHRPGHCWFYAYADKWTTSMAIGLAMGLDWSSASAQSQVTTAANQRTRRNLGDRPSTTTRDFCSPQSPHLLMCYIAAYTN